MPNPDELARPARLKIERANHHIKDLERQINAFLAQRPFKLMARFKPKLGTIAFGSEADQPIPDDFALIIGDAINYLTVRTHNQ